MGRTGAPANSNLLRPALVQDVEFSGWLGLDDRQAVGEHPCEVDSTRRFLQGEQESKLDSVPTCFGAWMLARACYIRSVPCYAPSLCPASPG